MSQAKSVVKTVVLDTNIVLDLFLFQDPRTALLREQLQSGQIQWRATAHMRNELERVLTYPHIDAKLAFYEKSSADILAAFDQYAQIIEPPAARAPYICKDADDQVFIDLACHLAANLAASAEGNAPLSADPLAVPETATATTVHLISKDKAVLSMRKRLEKRSVIVTMTF